MSTSRPARSVSGVVADAVAAHTREVFALLGNGNAHFTDALARRGDIRITGVRHEDAAVASADAYYRVARAIACATTSYGPGYTNTLTALDSLVRASRSAAVIVFNDACYGAEIHQYGSQGLHTNIMQIERPTSPRSGAGWGPRASSCGHWRTSSPCGGELTKADAARW